MKIVAEASSLSERLTALDNSAPDMEQVSMATKRLDRWCLVSAKGDWQRFRRRLLWDGLDIASVSVALVDNEMTQQHDLPAWATTVLRVSQATAAAGSRVYGDAVTILAGSPALPFQEIWLPTLAEARKMLLQMSPSVAKGLAACVSDEAYASMEYRLLDSLVELSAPVLLLEFRQAYPIQRLLLQTLLDERMQGQADSNYRRFTHEVMRGGLAGVFSKYPVMARLVALLIEHWVAETAEFILRLQQDRQVIQKVFAPRAVELGPVVQIQDGLSDVHNQRRVVKSLTFQCGVRVVYKPRGLAVDKIFQQLLAWCNSNQLSIPFRVLEVIDRNEYGWVEYVDHKSLPDEAAGHRYYVKTGHLLCLLYLLGATDCHHENLIASGEQPVIIDLETLAYHEVNWASSGSVETATLADYQQVWDSVLRTGLLPSWEFGDDKEAFDDVSGLGGGESQQTFERRRLWSLINTDFMALSVEKEAVAHENNVPILDGSVLPAKRYVDAIETGFREMYRMLRRQRQELLRASGPLSSLRGELVRFVVRATDSYARLLEHSLKPEFLRNGVDRSIELDRLSRNLTLADAKPREWPLLAAERQALEHMDIPLFGASTDSVALSYGVNEPLEGFFGQPSYQRIVERVSTLDAPDLERQAAMIRGSFHAMTMPVATSEHGTAINDHDKIAERIFDPIELTEAVGAIAKFLEMHAIPLAGGGYTWMNLDYHITRERYQYEPVNASLYEGVCGIALFLAAYGKLADNGRITNLALRALRPLRTILRNYTKRPVVLSGLAIEIGGMIGLGGLVYSLANLAELIGDDSLAEDAIRAANFLTPTMITSDRDLDLMTGAAGAALGLLALHRLQDDGIALEKAVICAEHLLQARSGAGSEPRAWITQGSSEPRAGFAHGAAGISYALLRLFAATGNRNYLEAAEEGMAYEGGVFLSEFDQRSGLRCPTKVYGQLAPSNGWCNGIAGICMSRLYRSSLVPSRDAERDVEIALKGVNEAELQRIDHLCCGNFGRVETLLVAHDVRGDEALLRRAQQTATVVVRRAMDHGEYCLLPELGARVVIPGFFRGVAGIGYGLLRLAYPASLRSIVMLE